MKTDKLNTSLQKYRGVPIRLIVRKYDHYNAKRYVINDTNQNVWIPNKHLEDDGTLKEGQNIDYVFKKARNQCRIAGVSVGWLKL